MSISKRFDAVIEGTDGGGAFVTVPFDVEAAFGKKRVKVRALIDGEPYRGSVVRMGGPDHILLVRKDVRERIGKGPGDLVEIVLEEDLEPRVVEVPADMREVLDRDPAAAAFFDTLSYTHRREYVQWIDGARRPQTRANRIAKAVEMLREQRKAR
jgi:hypothetical protein